MRVNLYIREGIDYIDADGTLKNTATDDIDGNDAPIELKGGEVTTLEAGWYYVDYNANYYGTVTISGDVHIILCNGCHMNIGSSESRLNDAGSKYISSSNALTLYGQSTGSNMGNLSVYTTGGYHPGIQAGRLTINGGNIIADTEGDYATSIYSYNSLTVNGGNISATATGTYARAISTEINFIFNGGTVTTAASASGAYAIRAYGKGYTFNWRNPGDYITIGNTGLYVKPASGFSSTSSATFNSLFTDGTTTYIGTLSGDNLNALAGKTLTAYGYALTANEAEGNRWTTFYSSQSGFSIDTDNAYAYTAVYDNSNSQLMLTKLGTDIPADCAVVIASDSSPVLLAINGTLGTFSGTNNLHGVDVRTLKSELGTGTFYVMGKVGSDFGFFQYTDDYMPARKAYLLLDGSEAQARSLTMVFGDEASGITDPTPDPSPAWEGSCCAWYTLDGRRMDGKPAKKGVYVRNGRKIVIK